jgi:hypothetical protein
MIAPFMLRNRSVMKLLPQVTAGRTHRRPAHTHYNRNRPGVEAGFGPWFRSDQMACANVIFRRWALVVVFTVFLCDGARAEIAPVKQGDAVTLGAHRFVIARLDAPPYVDSDYTRRFHFDAYANPKLKALRERYHLDQVVAAGKSEFDRQVLLLDWVNHRLTKFGKPTCQARGALDILQAADEGNTFFCSHYGDVLVSAAASLGWVDRPLALRRPNGSRYGSGPSTEHTSTEIWSNQFAKWVLFDPTFAMYVEKAGVPLSAYEFRQEWFYRDAKDVTFVLDKDRKRYRKSDMPVFRSHHPGFGDLVLDAGATDVYAFIGYIPNTDLMDRGPDYGKMFITKDRLCDGTPWHQRVAPADPARDPYFPIDQAAVRLTADGTSLRVTLKTLTPNFKTYQVRFDGGPWRPCDDVITWAPQADPSRVEVRAVNQYGVEGPVSTIEVGSRAAGS